MTLKNGTWLHVTILMIFWTVGEDKDHFNVQNLTLNTINITKNIKNEK